MKIDEVSYRLPSNGGMAFADFYTLNHLWFYFGEGQKASGYKPSAVHNVFPHKLAERIDRSFDEVALSLGKQLSEKVLEAIHGELENITDEFVIPDQKELRRYLEDNNVVLPMDSEGNMMLPPPREFWSKYGLAGAYKMFMFPGWVNPKSDAFGGKMWAGIVNVTRDLISAWKNDRQQPSKKNLIYAIDRLYDIEHNTGKIGDKLDNLAVSRDLLDKRFRARTIDDLVALGVSPYVESLVNAVKHFSGDAKHEVVAEGVKMPPTWGEISRGRYGKS